MTAYQQGSGIGTVVGPASDQPGGGTIAEAVSPQTAAGQALIVAAIGLAVLLFTVAREGGVVQRVGNAIGFVVVIAAASWIAQYAGRMYVLQHPDGPLADGVRFDS